MIDADSDHNHDCSLKKYGFLFFWPLNLEHFLLKTKLLSIEDIVYVFTDPSPQKQINLRFLASIFELHVLDSSHFSWQLWAVMSYCYSSSFHYQRLSESVHVQHTCMFKWYFGLELADRRVPRKDRSKLPWSWLLLVQHSPRSGFPFFLLSEKWSYNIFIWILFRAFLEVFWKLMLWVGLFQMNTQTHQLDVSCNFLLFFHFKKLLESVVPSRVRT